MAGPWRIVGAVGRRHRHPRRQLAGGEGCLGRHQADLRDPPGPDEVRPHAGRQGQRTGRPGQERAAEDGPGDAPGQRRGGALPAAAQRDSLAFRIAAEPDSRYGCQGDLAHPGLRADRHPHRHRPDRRGRGDGHCLPGGAPGQVRQASGRCRHRFRQIGVRHPRRRARLHREIPCGGRPRHRQRRPAWQGGTDLGCAQEQHAARSRCPAQRRPPGHDAQRAAGPGVQGNLHRWRTGFHGHRRGTADARRCQPRWPAAFRLESPVPHQRGGGRPRPGVRLEPRTGPSPADRRWAGDLDRS